MHIINIALYILGWVLFVAGQAKNSVSSKTNGLPAGFPGLKLWLSAHAVNLAQRAFFSGIFYTFLIHTVASEIQKAGMPFASYTIAGLAGFCANALLYQVFGLFPGLRVEIADFAPPPNQQIVPLPTSGTTNPNLGAKQ